MADSLELASVAAALRVDGQGALDEDLFCLDCGYNLRGLRGDPICCPECGHCNDLGTAAVPAPLIRLALHGMETYPTWCVVLTLGFAVMTWLAAALSVEGQIVACVGVIGLATGWVIAWGGVRAAFVEAQLGRKLVLEFHLITFIFLIPFGAALLALALDVVPGNPLAAVLLFAAPAGASWAIAGRRYRAARHRLAVGQREAAVRIAREALRRMMRSERG